MSNRNRINLHLAVNTTERISPTALSACCREDLRRLSETVMRHLQKIKKVVKILLSVTLNLSDG